MIKIHMGCGGQITGLIPGETDWINVDIQFDSQVFQDPRALELVNGYPRVMLADFRNPPFPDNFADLIYSHHSLEHININEVLPALQEWYRILKNGGTVHINVPDILWVAQQLCLHNGDMLWSEMGERTGNWKDGYTKLIHCIFGDQSHFYNLHRTGFTPFYLDQLLTDVGFCDLIIESVSDMGMKCIEAKGIKR